MNQDTISDLAERKRDAVTEIDALGTFVLCIVLVCGTVTLRADPPPGGKWTPIPELTDEFEGENLDSEKWHDHNPGWLGRYPGLFSTNNVSVSDGKLHLTARVEEPNHPDKKFHTFTTAAVKSKALVKYGYFEVKCRPMKSKASSAFWFYQDTPEEWTEIDVFEICGAGGKWNNLYNMTVHVFRTPTEKNTGTKPRNGVRLL